MNQLKLQPKFSVGEEVILQSPHEPKYNGEYIVEQVIPPLEKHICRLTGAITLNTTGQNRYILNFIFDLEDMKGREAWVLETSLRKKHKPSEFKDFTSLMNNLKLPQKSIA